MTDLNKRAAASADTERLMKRCQIGVGGRDARACLDEANNLLAECYGTLGAQQAEIDRLREAWDGWGKEKMKRIAVEEELAQWDETHAKMLKDNDRLRGLLREALPQVCARSGYVDAARLHARILAELENDK